MSQSPRTHKGAGALFALALSVLWLSLDGAGQQYGMGGTENGEWRHYTGSLDGSRYSPLDQIDASNFNDLEVAWRLKTDSFGNRPEFKLEGTPLMINGVLYTTAGTRRAGIAIDAKTGERIWHFQFVHHGIWDYDIPTAPALVDLTVEGRSIKAVAQVTKQAFTYVFDRVTGEPVWPIEERPVPQSDVPTEELSPTQPFPTWPLAYERQGLTVDDLIDYTPELREEALEIISQYKIGPIFNAPIHMGHPSGLRSFVSCPSGATNINGPSSADPELGILFVSSNAGCRSERLVPGESIDIPDDIMTTGTTYSEFAVLDRGNFRGPQGLPIFQPPYGRITAIDMNTGEHLWWIPNGDTPDRIQNHPALQGVDIPVTGKTSKAITLVTRTLLMTAEGATGDPLLHAIDKQTGEQLGSVELPNPGQYGMMTYMHEGNQYVVVQIGGADYPGSLAALRLP